MDRNFNINVVNAERIYNVIVTQQYREYTVNVINDVNVISTEIIQDTCGTTIVGPKGDKGDSAYEVWLQQNPGGTVNDFLDFLRGDDGLSAYQLALQEGFVGTLAQWLASLKGDQGDQGISAYQAWLNLGNIGTEEDYQIWLKANNTLEDARSRDNVILGPIDANNNTIENLPNAISAQQPVTKSQLDALELTLKAYSDALAVSNFNLCGDWDFSVGSYPTTGGTGTGGALRRGNAFRHNGVTTTFHGMNVEYGDIFYVITVPPGQDDTKWSSLDYNQQQAIETVAGVAKICTAAEAANENSTNDTDIVTPKKFWQNSWQRVLALAWTFAAKITFAVAPRFSSMTAGAMMKVDANKDLVPAVAGTDYTVPNATITAATKTKITYDSKGWIISATDATTDDIAEGVSGTRLYFTGARVLATVIAGFTAAAGTVTAADSILTAINKITGNIALKLDAANPTYTGLLSGNGGTLTVASTLYNIIATWNNGAAIFNGIFMNITRTASSNSSMLIRLQTNATNRFYIDVLGNGYISNSLDVGGGVSLGLSSLITYGNRSKISSSANGNVLFTNNAATDFSLLQFGGTTSSFPAIKRTTTGLQARLADDSDFTTLQSLYRRSGSGSPEGVISAPVGSTYHRTDGGAGTSFYVKESGGTGNTGWVAK